MGKYFQEDIETASREEIEQWQNEGLVSVVKRVYENVPYYRDLMDKAGAVSYTHLFPLKDFTI